MQVDTPTILRKIIARKYEEIEERQQRTPLSNLEIAVTAANAHNKPRGFAKAMRAKISQGKAAVIAEVKKASPSKGILRDHFVPKEIAKSYEKGGAACLSVLTDKDFFQGHEDFLVEARAACDLPVIRKDFLVDEYQVMEARAIGADCILLIAACLSGEQLRKLDAMARDLGMDVLVEVHNRAELDLALEYTDTELLGINNRDLHTFELSLQHTFELMGHVPKDRLIVTESGIHTRDDVAAMRENDIHSFLVGEAFMKADNPGDKLAELFK
ncbi:indole-3-glycerol phosphate synthase TrpC [Marinomonas mediterranea]|jgi:indole-3-glycerol phosphate synthase (EC 4.1.1.48)|uniref:Indole-3-glycerol phosphate synthase n=1 Tax=Marinomonas mediterranea (strain ATCC 700492 / JCM 21426 / NBRC 103028 / MMB-1) TaxID=717774 RepID=F2JT86_MARM1|nr:indole-3-glycerol phosphate synthase TrpC [Marinomonas mediterranea]ADZ90304.1 Indole-3-glycerol-phosphate synthase [Marinomonas mediterranea MMB-1]WCN12420.1 indole-3-glycerol phosphate synthase TrpC [Marinomonas mediterranea]WCN16493.1 indole-3-glycerol phosphate synthase TrpC [Marinomonas mediterranea MMB-1]